VEGLMAKLAPSTGSGQGGEDRTHRRKLARQAARSVLPNATETMIFVTANGRALRHFIELRGSENADAEIRILALKCYRLLEQEAPGLFGDYRIRRLDNGAEVLDTDFRGV